MKKITTLMLLLVIGISSFCQQPVNPNIKFQQQKLVSRSKTQRTIGWIMVGCGTALLIVTAVEQQHQNKDNGSWFDFSQIDNSLNTAAYVGGGLIVAGGAALLVAGYQNKTKAASLDVWVKPEPRMDFTQNTGFLKSFPAISIKYHF